MGSNPTSSASIILFLKAADSSPASRNWTSASREALRGLMRLHTKILIGLVAGLLTGGAARFIANPTVIGALVTLEPLGDGFISLISMVVIPLVVGSLTVATASLGGGRKLIGIGGKTLIYFLITTMIAVGIGLALALIVEPGGGMEPSTRDALSAQFQERIDGVTLVAESGRGVLDVLVAMIPRNPVAAAAEMDLLPLIIATLLFGAALGAIAEERRQVVLTFFRAINDTAMVIINWVMKLAPYAVFVLISSTVARFGLDLLERLFVYSLVVVVACLIHVFGPLALALLILGAGEGRRFLPSRGRSHLGRVLDGILQRNAPGQHQSPGTQRRHIKGGDRFRHPRRGNLEHEWLCPLQSGHRHIHLAGVWASHWHAGDPYDPRDSHCRSRCWSWHTG